MDYLSVSPSVQRVYDIIRPYFEVDYYNKTNTDVARSGIDSVIHYILYGESESRRPAEWFDVDKYRLLLDDDSDGNFFKAAIEAGYRKDSEILYPLNQDRLFSMTSGKKVSFLGSHPALDLLDKPTEWDLVFTCFEPLRRVTGGKLFCALYAAEAGDMPASLIYGRRLLHTNN